MWLVPCSTSRCDHQGQSAQHQRKLEPFQHRPQKLHRPNPSPGRTAYSAGCHDWQLLLRAARGGPKGGIHQRGGSMVGDPTGQEWGPIGCATHHGGKTARAKRPKKQLLLWGADQTCQGGWGRSLQSLKCQLLLERPAVSQNLVLSLYTWSGRDFGSDIFSSVYCIILCACLRYIWSALMSLSWTPDFCEVDPQPWEQKW